MIFSRARCNKLNNIYLITYGDDFIVFMGNVPHRNKVVGNTHAYNVNLIVFGFRSVKSKIKSTVIFLIM